MNGHFEKGSGASLLEADSLPRSPPFVPVRYDHRRQSPKLVEITKTPPPAQQQPAPWPSNQSGGRQGKNGSLVETSFAMPTDMSLQAAAPKISQSEEREDHEYSVSYNFNRMIDEFRLIN